MHLSSSYKNLYFFPLYTKFTLHALWRRNVQPCKIFLPCLNCFYLHVWIVFIFRKEDMFLAQSLNNKRIALFLVFSSRKTLHHRFDKSRSYFSGKLKQRREKICRQKSKQNNNKGSLQKGMHWKLKNNDHYYTVTLKRLFSTSLIYMIA